MSEGWWPYSLCLPRIQVFEKKYRFFKEKQIVRVK